MIKKQNRRVNIATAKDRLFQEKDGKLEKVTPVLPHKGEKR